MSDHRDDRRRASQEFGRRIGRKEMRRLRARRQGESIWYGLGVFGVIGWSVTIPTLLGILLGLWIDANLPSRFSWTLMLFFLGVALGCWNAWRWVQREQRMIRQIEQMEDEERDQ